MDPFSGRVTLEASVIRYPHLAGNDGGGIYQGVEKRTGRSPRSSFQRKPSADISYRGLENGSSEARFGAAGRSDSCGNKLAVWELGLT